MESIYKPVVQYKLTGIDKEKLGSTVNRKCRFCGKDEKRTTFSTIAHTVPELLGNTRLISCFECDSCNKKVFSQYESDLANFLQLYRGFRGVRGKKGKVKLAHGCAIDYNSETGTLNFKTEDFKQSKNGISIYSSLDGSSLLVQNIAKYIPLNVYKAFLKPALSMLDEDVINSYSNYIDLLFSSNTTLVSPESYNIYTIVLNAPTTTPKIILYKKTQIIRTAPSILVSIEALHYVFNIFLFMKYETILPYKKNIEEFKKMMHYYQYDAFDLMEKNFFETHKIRDTQMEYVYGRSKNTPVFF